MSELLSAEQLDKIKNRCDKATPGPWFSSIEGRDHDSGDNVIIRGENGMGEDLYLHGGTIFDYDFVASAKQDIPLLLDEISRLHKIIEQYRSVNDK